MSTQELKKLKKLITIKEDILKNNRKLFEVKNAALQSPSPESILRINNKLDLLNSFKSSFQTPKLTSRYLTPIQKSEPRLQKVNLTSINIKNYGLGDNQAKALSSTIKSMNRLEKINLRGNGMKDAGTSSILASVSREKIRDLDISSNKIGINGIESLAEILTSNFSSLEDLNLENSKLNLRCLLDLCNSLRYNKSLKSLNLANNNIGLGAGSVLGNMLDYNDHLEVLDLQ